MEKRKKQSSDRRRLAIHFDYAFGRGVSRYLPSKNMKLVFSRRSGRLKLVFHEKSLFATIKPAGSIALSLYGARFLLRSPAFKENCVTVSKDASQFVSSGKSVFCKFVVKAGRNILPKGEVVVLGTDGELLGVGKAVINGKYMAQFKSGVAVKVRAGARH